MSLVSKNMRCFGAWVICSLILCGIFAGAVWGEGEGGIEVSWSHFPDRSHAFIWRNWESVGLEKMAEVLGTDEGTVEEVGLSMGLPRYVEPGSVYMDRGYISIIRRNWHLISYEQMLTLLGWEAERLDFTLREDDGVLWKLGGGKGGRELKFIKPDEAAKKRCAEIKGLVKMHFGGELGKSGEKRFGFVEEISKVDEKGKPIVLSKGVKEEPIRFLYSYFGLYGDPLLNPELDPYPEGLLGRLSELGVNGVWMHTVLRQLAPSKTFKEFGKGCEQRLENLRKLVNKCKRYGIKVYLYMNEPRAMKEEFFVGREEMKGVREGDYFALCSSVPEVREWITEALKHVFSTVPGLGGIFTITASENLTNCYCRDNGLQCPRCGKRRAADVIGELNKAMASGVWQGNPEATVIVWDWGWKDGWVKDIIGQLPKEVYLMSVSEWCKPIVRGGVASEVGEYSLSAVGPGPRALRHWGWAKERGVKCIAKIQTNCSWELSAVPYLPVMNLVSRHVENLSKADVDGLMLSWTLGGSPSPNLQLVRQFSQGARSAESAMRKVATARYGGEALEEILSGWTKFSEAFEEYPFHIDYVYTGPTQMGPANLLYAKPTGMKATPVGYPFDDVDGWRAIYPGEVLGEQFEKMALGWQEGLVDFEKALEKIDSSKEKENLKEDYRIAEAAFLHFRSVANQIKFILARDDIRLKRIPVEERKARLDAISGIVREEMGLAERLYVISKKDSRIGYEASNQYYYFPMDMIEKVINCEYILKKVRTEGSLN
ncbi:MAG: hypothetical protein JXD22_12140 [Sedimentisphaerales bacterium]|nr:hypothetical protein [Sedimentisphaerales bacterium]